MKVTVMLKDGGYDTADIPYKQVGRLADKIEKEGAAALYTASGSTIHAVGFMVTGKQTGERLIVLNKPKEAEQVEANG